MTKKYLVNREYQELRKGEEGYGWSSHVSTRIKPAGPQGIQIAPFLTFWVYDHSDNEFDYFVHPRYGWVRLALGAWQELGGTVSHGKARQ